MRFAHLHRSSTQTDLRQNGTTIGVDDVITCDKYFGDWLKADDSVRGKNLLFPIDKVIAVNAGLALSRSP